MAGFVERAGRHKTFRTRLVTEPRATVEQELGVTLPARLAIHVHQETPESLHVVLPLAADELNSAVLAETELSDREVAGYDDETGKGTRPFLTSRLPKSVACAAKQHVTVVFSSRRSGNLDRRLLVQAA